MILGDDQPLIDEGVASCLAESQTVTATITGVNMSENMTSVSSHTVSDAFGIDLALLRTDEPILEVLSSPCHQLTSKEHRTFNGYQSTFTEQNTLNGSEGNVYRITDGDDHIKLGGSSAAADEWSSKSNVKSDERDMSSNGASLDISDGDIKPIIISKVHDLTSEHFSIYKRKASHDSTLDVSCDLSLEDAIEHPSKGLRVQMDDSDSATLRKPTANNSADVWIQFNVPSNVQSLSVSARHAWCVDVQSRLHFAMLQCTSLQWCCAIGAPAQQISVAPSGWIVWRLHSGSAYAASGVTKQSPFGVKWTEVVREVTCISVDNSSAW